MTVERITDSRNPLLKELINLYETAFPPEERTENETLLHLIDTHPGVFFHAIKSGDELAGFFLYWDLGECVYLHYLVTYPHLRNRKIGQKVLDYLAHHISTPIFLEAEPPTDDITTRRINYYKRNGYQVLAENPEMLYVAREKSCPLWFLGNQPVEDVEKYLLLVRDNVYRAVVE